MNKYEELMFKSELAEVTARKADSNCAWKFQQNVADKLKNMARSLPLEELVD